MRMRTRILRVLTLLGIVTALMVLLPDVAAWADPSGGDTGGAADTGVGRDLNQNNWEQLLDEVGHQKIAINFVWTLFAAVLVLFMSAGFAMLESGFCRARHAAHVLMTNFVILFIAMLGFWAAGFALMFGGTQVASLGGTAVLTGIFEPTDGWGLFGTNGWFLSGNAYDVGVAALFMFQVVFLVTAATIPTGAMAERWRFSAFVIYGFFTSMFLYPIFGNWVWGGGWLSQLGDTWGLGHGYVDWAGSSVIHAVGGLVGLAGTLVLRPRIGKYNRDGSPNPMPAHNVPMGILGTYILIFGWFGFNAGSTLAGTDLRISVIVVNTMLAGCAGAFTTMLIMWGRFGAPEPPMTANGFLAGLVAVTGPSAFVSAVLIGAVAGVIVVGAVVLLERAWRVDDPVGAVPVHAACGIWGVLAAGLFADGTYGDGYNGIAGGVRGLFYGDTSQLLAQFVGAGTVIAWVFPLAYGFFRLQHRLMGIRVPPEVELAGVDIPELGAMAYPDFLEARGDVFIPADGDGGTSAAAPAVSPAAPAAVWTGPGVAGPDLRIVRGPASGRPDAPAYHFAVDLPGVYARLPVWREARSRDPYVKEVYRTEVFGRLLERGNLPSLEAAVREVLAQALRDGQVPPYVLYADGDQLIPVVRHGRVLRAGVGGRWLEGRDLAEVHATVAEHLTLRQVRPRAGVAAEEPVEPRILAVAPEDLRGMPPVFLLRHRDMWIPAFARPWGSLYVEVSGRELEAGPGVEGALALRAEAAQLVHESGRLYDPLDLGITEVISERWVGWTAGLTPAEDVTVSWSARPLPAFRVDQIAMAAVPGPDGKVSVYLGRDRFDLTARIEAAIRERSLVARPM